MMDSEIDSEGYVQSNYWLDQPNAAAEISRRQAKGEFSEVEAERLQLFSKDGYCTFQLKNCDATVEHLANSFDALWEFRSRDLMGASGKENSGRPQPLADFPEKFSRGPGTRLLDVHAHMESARALYLNPQIHRTIHNILDAKPVATQSLLFEYGSGQTLHRDPWFVVTRPISSLIAAWIALEDIHIDSGPLSFVPGSHRLPYHTFDNGGIVMHAPGITHEQKMKAVNEMSQDIERKNMPIQKFTAKKGEVFLWHGSLTHGGSPVRNPELTRKSLVIHFDDIGCHPRRGSSVRKEDGTTRQVYTGQLMTNRNNVGFECPIRLSSQVAYSEYLERG